MSRKIFFLLSIAIISCGSRKKTVELSTIQEKVDCTCDTTRVIDSISKPSFNYIRQYDEATFDLKDFYNLSAEENQKLWFRDVENPDTTRFTRYWNDYLPNNYRTSHLKFIKEYQNKTGVELAFQLGPNDDLWAYHIFVFKKIHCCYLVTRSYFRHARFTYKAYAIINSAQMDTMFTKLEPLSKQKTDTAESWNYCAYFADNRNHKNYFIDIDQQEDSVTHKINKETGDFFDFIDKKIPWRVSYN